MIPACGSPWASKCSAVGVKTPHRLTQLSSRGALQYTVVQIRHGSDGHQFPEAESGAVVAAKTAPRLDHLSLSAFPSPFQILPCFTSLPTATDPLRSVSARLARVLCPACCRRSHRL